MSSLNAVRWLSRRVPAMLLSLLFLTVALSKAAAVIDEIGSFKEGISSFRILLTLHLTSSIIFFTIVAILALTRAEPIRREKRLIGWVLPLIVTATLSGIGFAEPQEYPVSVMAVATFFVLCGTIFTVYSLRHLGRHFGVVSDVRGLVTTGPYRYVRHPLYGGETLTALGLMIAVASPLSVAAFVVGIALQIWRAKVEEQALTSVFPEYKSYAARTPMLIPFVKAPASTLMHPRTAE